MDINIKKVTIDDKTRKAIESIDLSSSFNNLDESKIPASEYYAKLTNVKIQSTDKEKKTPLLRVILTWELQDQSYIGRELVQYITIQRFKDGKLTEPNKYEGIILAKITRTLLPNDDINAGNVFDKIAEAIGTLAKIKLSYRTYQDKDYEVIEVLARSEQV